MILKNIFSLTLSLIFSLSAYGSQQHYMDGFIRYELVQTKYKQVYLDLTDINRREALQSWFRLFFKNPENKAIYEQARGHLNRWIKSEEYKNLLFYYHMTGQNESAINTFGLYLLSVDTLLKEFALDPFNRSYQASDVNSFEKFLQNSDFKKIAQIEQCYRGLILNNKRQFDINYISQLNEFQRTCLFRDAYVIDLIKGLDSLMHGNAAKGAPHPINYQGFIADNSIQLWNKIPTSEDAISSLGEQLGLIHTATNQKLSLKYSEMSVEDFKKLMDNESTAIDDLFTRNEGFLQRESHLSLGPVTLAQPGIYQHILEAIDQAKETAFVDIFWMGGSIGVQLAKALMKKTLANPQFKVYIITDTVNRFNYGTQLDTVYRYIRAFSEKFPQRSFYIVPASLDLKRTALPEFVDLLFTNSTVNLSQKNVALDPLFADHRFNLIGKSDHSKVVVIDGKNPNDGKAFVGSKNWTDASGGIATDEVAEIQGPAVAAILNHYYYDVIEGFLLESRKGNYILDHFAAQFPQEKSKSKYQAIQYLIAGIDVLNRYESDNIFVKQIPYVEKGSDTIALGQNNIYGTETSAVDQNIHAILQAKEQIIIDDQFLYDPFIASALKTAITKHNVKVYLMLESLTAVGDDSKLMAHVPNNLFLPELIALGAKAKWKEVPKDMANTILATKEKYGHLLAPEFHLKSITVDGVRENEYALCQQDQPSLRHHDTVPALITGSANKDVMTMTGGFREYQVLLYSESAVLRHDCIFWSRWQSAHETIATDGLDFELPPEAKNIDVGQEDFLNILRMVFFSTYNFTKDYF